MQKSSLNYRLSFVIAIMCAAVLFSLVVFSEVPTGNLKGTAIAKESGIPLEANIFVQRIIDKKNHKYDEYRSVKANSRGEFELALLPTGRYLVEMFTQAHEAKPVEVDIQEGQTVRMMAAELAPKPPELNVYIHQQVFTPDEKGQITCEGFMPSKDIAVRIYKIKPESFAKDYNCDLRRLVWKDSSNYVYGQLPLRNIKKNTAVEKVMQFSSPVKNRDREGIFTYRINIPKLGSGLYLVSAAASGIESGGWMFFTSLGMVTKNADGKLVAYTTDLKTGTPVSGAKVQVYSRSNVLCSGTTGTDGTISLKLPQSDQNENASNVLASANGSIALSSAWLQNASASSIKVYGYTERPVYRPGQRIFYKGIARIPDGAGFKIPKDRPVRVDVRDPQDTLIYQDGTLINQFGSFNGSFTLPDDTATGEYTLTYTIDGQEADGTASFSVAEYRKPEFKASLRFNKKRYTRGEMITAKISTEYYFGSPVANAQVTYSVRRSDYWLYDDVDERSAFEEENYESSSYGEYVLEGKATTNDRGEAIITFPAEWTKPRDELIPSLDQLFTVEVSVVDRSNQEVSIFESVPATVGDFAIHLSPDRYVIQPGEKAVVEVNAKDYNHRAISGQQIDLRIGRQTWTNDEHEFIERERRQVTTDANGNATLEIKADKPGDIFILAETRDRRSNRIVATESIWVYSDAWVDTGEKMPELDITTDKKEYKAGENAVVLISSEYTGATALVTVEGERLYDYFTIPINKRVMKIVIPIKEEYRPNFEIGVCYVRKKNLIRQSASVRVSIKSQVLDVQVETDKPVYKPGETATCQIRTLDTDGQPVRAEVSIGVVDEAIYAIAEDTTDPIQDYFYARKDNQVRTTFSFPELYLSDPDKAGLHEDVVVRKKFVDTAFWNPTVETDASGSALVSFTLPDNITTWRITARAITQETVCGEVRSTFIARKELMVRLEMPRFLTSGDRSTLTAAIHNYTDSAIDVDVDLKAAGLKLLDDAKRRVNIGKDEDVRVDWEVTAGKAGKHSITVTAISPRISDAVQLILPILHHGQTRHSVYAGAVSGNKTQSERISIRDDVDLNASEIKVDLEPSLAVSMLPALKYLASYPYGCTEQTTSSFLPNVIIWKILKKSGLKDDELEKKIPDMVRAGLSKLQQYQVSDGSWGWCEYGRGDLWMTAYVCYALIRAREAGFSVNDEILGHGIYALEQLVQRKNADPDDRAYGYYVLTLAGRNISAPLMRFVGKSRLDARGMAYITLALAGTGQSEYANQIFASLMANAKDSSGFIYWTSKDDYMSRDVEATSAALLALMKFKPQDPRIEKAVKWLMLNRQGNGWYSTRDTAAVLYTLSVYLGRTRELVPDYTVVAKLNGKNAGVYRFTQSSLTKPSISIRFRGKQLLKGDNTLNLIKKGKGILYYTADLSQFVVSKEAYKYTSEEGLRITRLYYRPSPRYFQSKSVRDLGRAITSCGEGDVVTVKLKIYSPGRFEHLLLEDRLPAGFEVVDRGHIDYYDWNYMYSARDIRDTKVSFYIESLDRGYFSVEYQMRAMAHGEYSAMPAEVFGMYRPDLRSTTEEETFTVR